MLPTAQGAERERAVQDAPDEEAQAAADGEHLKVVGVLRDAQVEDDCLGRFGLQLAVGGCESGDGGLLAGGIETRETVDVYDEDAVDGVDRHRGGGRRPRVLAARRVRRQRDCGAGERVVESRQHAVDRDSIVLIRARRPDRGKGADQCLVPVDVAVGQRRMGEFYEAP